MQEVITYKGEPGVMSNRNRKLEGMGEVNGNLDHRMRDIMTLLEYVPSKAGKVLDIGLGKGQISEWFLGQKGVDAVEGIGLEIESYGIKKDLFEKGLHVTECSVEDLPFENEYFDIVVASHILEHVSNMGIALNEIHRVLKRGGHFYIFLPHYTEQVCAGHINTGWNLGQLMYVLLINGFNVKSGNFIEYGYNLCAFVQKTKVVLPKLTGDRGDIDVLNEAGLFPVPIHKGTNDLCDTFDGNFRALNWKNAELLFRTGMKDKKYH